MRKKTKVLDSPEIPEAAKHFRELPSPIPTSGNSRDQLLLRALFNTSPLGIFYSAGLDKPGYANDTFIRLFGYPDEQPFVPNPHRMIHPDDLEESLESIASLRQGARRRSGVRKMLRADGSVFHARVETTFIPPEPGSDGLLILMISDISDQIDTIEDYRHTRELVRMHQAQSLVGEIEIDNDMRVTRWNPAAERILSYRREEAIGKIVFDLFISDDTRKLAKKSLRKIIKSRQPEYFLQNHVTRDGRNIVCEWYTTPLTDSQGSPKGVAVLCLDVTEREMMQRARDENENRLRQIIESHSVPVIIRRERDDRVLFVNKPFLSLARLPEDMDPENIPPDAVLEEDALAEVNRVLNQCGEVSGHEIETRIEGKQHNVLVSIHKVEIQSEPSWMMTILDLTALQESREETRKLAAIINASVDFIGMTDTWGRPRYINPAGRRLLGLAPDCDPHTLRLLDFHPANVAKRVRLMWREVVREGRFEGEFLLRNFATNETIPCHLQVFLVRNPQTGRVIASAVIARDLRQQKRTEEERWALEQQILHAQKLEGLGVLAGGVAHDFNNLLMTVLGNVSLALAEERLNAGLRQYLENIEQSARHASELTGQLLTYSGKAARRTKDVDLCEVIKEMENLLKSAAGKRCDVQFLYEENVPGISADPAQLRQVVMNLVINASDAIEEKIERTDGKIVFRVGARRLEVGQTKGIVSGSPFLPGNFVVMEVSDNGIGMDTVTRERIFEPFYSTKFDGRGLGLASVFGIIRGHQGGILVESKRGKGTTFRLYFPAGRVSATGAPSEMREQMEEWRSTRTILVVDDEEPVRYVCRLILEQHGLNVLTAENGEEALKIYEENRDRVDIILLDMMMPQMSGDETLKLLRELNDDVRVILSSGFSETDLSKDMEILPNAFIQKPYLPDDLVRTVREVVESGQSQKT
ncbi:MAG: PAS domain S-box protein [bacterium]